MLSAWSHTCSLRLLLYDNSPHYYERRCWQPLLAYVCKHIYLHEEGHARCLKMGTSSLYKDISKLPSDEITSIRLEMCMHRLTYVFSFLSLAGQQRTVCVDQETRARTWSESCQSRLHKTYQHYVEVHEGAGGRQSSPTVGYVESPGCMAYELVCARWLSCVRSSCPSKVAYTKR